jgi:hypothetical protein
MNLANQRNETSTPIIDAKMTCLVAGRPHLSVSGVGVAKRTKNKITRIHTNEAGLVNPSRTADPYTVAVNSRKCSCEDDSPRSNREEVQNKIAAAISGPNGFTVPENASTVGVRPNRIALSPENL